MNSESETNGSYQGGNMHHIARRFQLYVGNLTWVSYTTWESKHSSCNF